MREIPLTQGQVALVDAEDYEWLMQWKWHAIKAPYTFYAARKTSKTESSRTIYMHREIVAAKIGSEVDHRDGNGLNNVSDNLRAVTPSENRCNSKTHADNSTGYKGVGWHSVARKWRARIRLNGVEIHLGLFNTPQEAHEAYCKAAVNVHGEFARTA